MQCSFFLSLPVVVLGENSMRETGDWTHTLSSSSSKVVMRKRETEREAIYVSAFR